jgi:hypothetical protein
MEPSVTSATAMACPTERTTPKPAVPNIASAQVK